MTNIENPIAPKLRPGEVLPEAPGMIPTRHYGEIVLVSAPTETDELYGNSPYTKRQVSELETMRIDRMTSKLVHEGTLFQTFFPGESPESGEDMTIELVKPFADHLDYNDLG